MESSDLFKAAVRRGVPLRMLTGVSSQRHADGKRSILKIRRAAKRTSRRVVGVRSVKRDLSVLIFRCSLLDLSLVALTQSSLSDSNLPLIYHSEKWVQTGSTLPPRSALMHLLNLLCVWSLREPRWSRLTTPLSLSRSVHWAPPDGVIAGQLPANVSLRLSSRRNRCLSLWLLYPRGSSRSDVKHFQGVNGDLTSQHVATTDRTFMRLGQNSSLKKHLGLFLITICNISQLWMVKLASWIF